MTTPIFILVIIFSVGLGCGVGAWFIFQRRLAATSRKATRKTTPANALPFRWSYIILPVTILFLSIVLTACFYHLLPAEVAYHFKADGSADKWLSRGMIVAWTLTPQVLLTLLAAAITWGITRLNALFRQTEVSGIRPTRIISLMGNMVALPQSILCFAMLDIFSYNSYQIHLIPLWVFALTIMGLGGIILGIFFIHAMRRAQGATR